MQLFVHRRKRSTAHGQSINRCDTFFFFFSDYQSITDHCCLLEVSSTISVISQQKGYILEYLFQVTIYCIDPTGSWSPKGLFLYIFPTNIFLICYSSALQVYLNYSSRLFLINTMIFSLLYNFCSSSFFLLS